MNPQIQCRVIAFLRDFRQLCSKHHAFLGLDGTLELLIKDCGSVFFPHLCGNCYDAGCTFGREHISDLDPRVLAG